MDTNQKDSYSREDSNASEISSPSRVRMFSEMPKKQAEFDEYAFPARIEQAEIHEKATSLGNPILGGLRCVCCDANSGKEKFHWFKDSISKAVTPSRGVTIPLMFKLMKYYTISIFLIFCLNGVATIYEYSRMCDIYPNKCVQLLWLLPLMENTQLMNLIEKDNLARLQWMDFASYILILLCSMAIDNFIASCSKEEHMYESAQNSENIRTVIVSNIPVAWKSQDLQMALSQKQSNLLIKQVFFLRDTSMFHDTFNKRNQTFFNYMSLLEKSKIPNVTSTRNNSLKIKVQQAEYEKLQDDIEKSLTSSTLSEQNVNTSSTQKQKKEEDTLQSTRKDTIQLCKKLHEMAEDISSQMPFRGKAIVTLGSYEEAEAVKKQFSQSFLMKVQTFLRALFFISREQPQEGQNLLVQSAPACEETKWENLSVCIKQKGNGMAFAWIISLITAALFVIILVFVQQNITGFYIIIANVFLSIVYAIILEILVEKKRGTSVTSRNQFVMTRQGFFTLIYFACFPVVYYGYFANAEEKSLPVYQLFLIFFINTIVQFFFVYINLEKRPNKSFKKKIQKQPNILNSMPQQMLNEKYKKPEFPLEGRLLGVLQLWTFSTLHAFICPYTLPIAMIFLIVYYYVFKYRLFNEFSLHTRKHIKLIRRFITLYTTVFQFAVLFMYSISKATDLQRILAYIAFAVLYIGSHIVQSYRSPISVNQNNSNCETEHLLQLSINNNISFTDSYVTAYHKFITKHENSKFEEKIEDQFQEVNAYLSDVIQSKISSVFARTEFI